MNSYISSLSSLDNRYIFLFLSTNLSFVSIVSSQSFLVGILSLCFFLSKNVNLLVKTFWYQLFCFFFWLHYFFLFILYFPFFYYLLYFYHFLLFWLFIFSIPIFLALASIASYTLLGILSFSSSQSSNWPQDYSIQAMVFPRLHFTSIL